jgi:hypothetical protein
VARHTTIVYFFRGGFLESKDLCYVATAGNVGGARTVAGLATLMRRTVLCVEGRLPVGGLFPSVINVRMASLTGLRAHIRWCRGGRRTGRRHAGRRSVFISRLWSSLTWNRKGKEKQDHGKKSLEGSEISWHYRVFRHLGLRRRRFKSKISRRLVMVSGFRTPRLFDIEQCWSD